MKLWVLNIDVTSCDLQILVDQPSEAVPAHDAHTGHVAGRMYPPGGRGLLQRPVRPVRVEVIDVLAEDQPQVIGRRHANQSVVRADPGRTV